MERMSVGRLSRVQILLFQLCFFFVDQKHCFSSTKKKGERRVFCTRHGAFPSARARPLPLCVATACRASVLLTLHHGRPAARDARRRAQPYGWLDPRRRRSKGKEKKEKGGNEGKRRKERREEKRRKDPLSIKSSSFLPFLSAVSSSLCLFVLFLFCFVLFRDIPIRSARAGRFWARDKSTMTSSFVWTSLCTTTTIASGCCASTAPSQWSLPTPPTTSPSPSGWTAASQPTRPTPLSAPLPPCRCVRTCQPSFFFLFLSLTFCSKIAPSEHVDSRGRVYDQYLHTWDASVSVVCPSSLYLQLNSCFFSLPPAQVSTISGLCDMMCQRFAAKSPVYAKPVEPPPPPVPMYVHQPPVFPAPPITQPLHSQPPRPPYQPQMTYPGMPARPSFPQPPPPAQARFPYHPPGE
jgi:hypothetical protein